MGIADPALRMRRLGQLVRQQRGEPALGLTEEVSGVRARLPRAVSVGLIGSMLKAVDPVTSNAPGSPIPLFCRSPEQPPR